MALSRLWRWEKCATLTAPDRAWIIDDTVRPHVHVDDNLMALSPNDCSKCGSKFIVKVKKRGIPTAAPKALRLRKQNWSGCQTDPINDPSEIKFVCVRVCVCTERAEHPPPNGLDKQMGAQMSTINKTNRTVLGLGKDGRLRVPPTKSSSRAEFW